MSPLLKVAVLIAIVAVLAGVYIVGMRYLNRGLDIILEPPRPAPEPVRDPDPLRQVEWWPRVWGVEHGDVVPVRDDQDVIYDWQQRHDIPPAYVGGGRGHAL